MLPTKLHETAEGVEGWHTQMRKDILANSSNDQTQHYVRLLTKLPLHHSVLHQVNPSGECYITQAQRTNSEIQRRIRVLHGLEIPPKDVKFTSRFFQKWHKKKRKLTVVNDVLYQILQSNVEHEIHRQVVVTMTQWMTQLRHCITTPCKDTLAQPKCCTSNTHNITCPIWPR